VPSSLRREAASALSRPVRGPIDGGGLSGLTRRFWAGSLDRREDRSCALWHWAPRGWLLGRCPGLADYVIATGLTDGATAPPEVMALREFRSHSQIPTLFPH